MSIYSRDEIQQMIDEELEYLDRLEKQKTNTKSITNHYLYELEGPVKKKKRKKPRLDEFGRRLFDEDGHYILPENRKKYRQKKKKNKPTLDEFGRRVYDLQGHYIPPEKRPSIGRVERIKIEIERYLGPQDKVSEVRNRRRNTIG